MRNNFQKFTALMAVAMMLIFTGCASDEDKDNLRGSWVMTYEKIYESLDPSNVIVQGNSNTSFGSDGSCFIHFSKNKTYYSYSTDEGENSYSVGAYVMTNVLGASKIKMTVGVSTSTMDYIVVSLDQNALHVKFYEEYEGVEYVIERQFKKSDSDLLEMITGAVSGGGSTSTVLEDKVVNYWYMSSTVVKNSAGQVEGSSTGSMLPTSDGNEFVRFADKGYYYGYVVGAETPKITGVYRVQKVWNTHLFVTCGLSITDYKVEKLTESEMVLNYKETIDGESYQVTKTYKSYTGLTSILDALFGI